MTRLASSHVPKYRHHKPTGQAVVTLAGKDHYLGKHGSAASKEKYARLIAEWLERGPHGETQPGQAENAPLLRVNELILAYLRHAQDYYRNSEKEVEKIRLSLRPLRQLYGRSEIGAFGPLALKTVRTQMCQTLTRSTVNMRIGVLKRMFKWAVANELIPSTAYESLRAVEGLKKGRSAARETTPVKPVTEEQVNAILPFLNRHVRAMVQFQWLTGCRSGELCVLRACDIDMSGPVWIYSPPIHKNSYRGQDRMIFIGPQAQAVLRQFLTREPGAYAFCPRLAILERHMTQRKERKSKIPPSQRNRRKRSPKRKPGDHYNVRSYYHAVRKACQRAGVELWHPHQVRHAAATRFRKAHGIEIARIILGHKTAFTTEIYAEADRVQASEIVAKNG
jgi:integrase